MKAPFDVIGYADPMVTHSQETVAFKLSADRPVRASIEIVRFLCADPLPTGPGVEYELIETIAQDRLLDRYQKVPAGSYAILPYKSSEPRFTIGLLVWPTLIGKQEQTILSRWDSTAEQGICLTITAEGELALTVSGAGGQSQSIACDMKLEDRRWYFVAAVVDAVKGELTLRADGIDKQFLEEMLTTKTQALELSCVDLSDVPLVLASRLTHENGRALTNACFNGKLEHPVVVSEGVFLDQLKDFVVGDADCIAKGKVLADWNFSRDITGKKVTDITANGAHGTAVNLPARGVTGYHFTGDILDWRGAPEQFSAIHFHDDDLYDCEWETDFEWQVPQGVQTGFYGVRIAGEDIESWISFFVCAGMSEAKNKIAFVASTATFLAYANTRHRMDVGHIEQLYNALIEVSPTEAYLRCRRDLGPSTYDTHADGSGAFYSSSLRPILNMRPGKYTFNFINDSHLISWLEKKGIQYDVIADDDIHKYGKDILSQYDVVITGSHPEYISTSIHTAFDEYQNSGGRHMYLGGNGFYWRIGYPSDSPGAIEMRRGFAGVRTWESDPGEVHLSSTGEPGGLWREHGKGPHKLVGVGFSSCVFDRSTYYRRTESSHNPKVSFIFEGIEEDAKIGDSGYRGGGAAGMELDRASEALGTPRHALIVATTENVGAGGSVSSEEFITTPRAIDGEQNGRVRADIVFFETRNGGAVFTPGSIAWPTSLLCNNTENDVSRMTENVINRFLDPSAF
nr:N,N-dimethylformamidase beta subunit family domain-containing protein [uncultured Roseovarius sp.]